MLPLTRSRQGSRACMSCAARASGLSRVLDRCGRQAGRTVTPGREAGPGSRSLASKERALASIMLQYDRPTDHTRNWNDYNGRVRDWIARLLQTPGAVSFLAYRTGDGASPNT